MYGFFKSNRYPVNIRRQIAPFYCGVCKSIEEFFGLRGRLFASYDAAMPLYFNFLRGGEAYDRSRESCYFRVVNPVKIVGPGNTDSLFLGAVTLLYLKLSLEDKKLDGEFSFRYRAVEKFATIAMENGIKYLNSTGFNVREYDEILRGQVEYEKKTTGISVDFSESSRFSARAFEKVYAELGQDELWLETGRNHGEIVYFWDALMDLKKDHSNNSFNPLFSYSKDEIKELFDEKFGKLEHVLLELASKKNSSELREFMEFNRKEKRRLMEKCLKKTKKFLK